MARDVPCPSEEDLAAALSRRRHSRLPPRPTSEHPGGHARKQIFSRKSSMGSCLSQQLTAQWLETDVHDSGHPWMWDALVTSSAAMRRSCTRPSRGFDAPPAADQSQRLRGLTGCASVRPPASAPLLRRRGARSDARHLRVRQRPAGQREDRPLPGEHGRVRGDSCCSGYGRHGLRMDVVEPVRGGLGDADERRAGSSRWPIFGMARRSSPVPLRRATSRVDHGKPRRGRVQAGSVRARRPCFGDDAGAVDPLPWDPRRLAGRTGPRYARGAGR